MPIGIIHNISTFSKKLALLRLQSIINLTILRTMDEQHIYITVLHSKKIHFTQNQHINASFSRFKFPKKATDFRRNIFVAASSMPFNLIATTV